MSIEDPDLLLLTRISYMSNFKHGSNFSYILVTVKNSDIKHLFKTRFEPFIILEGEEGESSTFYIV